MRVLVTGAAGFLGSHLIPLLFDRGHEVIGTTRTPRFAFQQLDFTDPFQVHDFFEKFQPEIVIHAGAMTRVDACEEQQWLAYQTNVEGTLNLLLNADECKSFFLFVSTDFVFDGKKGSYVETDERNPVNFYGKTKLEAEDAVMEYPHDWSIVRTSLVYGKPPAGKSNILSTIRERLVTNESYNVVDDQFRTPTYVEDLAIGILAIIENRKIGIYHLSGADILTPYAMAIEVAAYLKADSNLIKRVTSETFSQPAKRPQRTDLSIEKARKDLNYVPLSFELGLKKTFS